jgi:23S rRNA-/tRNA-specific pseudouridylate synthase
MVNRLIHHYGNDASKVPYVLHRLDYNTSGLLLFGKSAQVVPGIHAQFR